MSKHRIGWKRLCAALILCALVLNAVPMAGLMAHASMSYDASDFTIDFYVVDTLYVRHYFDQISFQAGNTISAKSACDTLPISVWEGVVFGAGKDEITQYPNYTGLQFLEYNVNTEVQDFLRLTEEHSDEDPVYKVPDADGAVYSGGYYGELTENEEYRDYLTKNPLFNVSVYAYWDDEHWEDYTFDDLHELTKEKYVNNWPYYYLELYNCDTDSYELFDLKNKYIPQQLKDMGYSDSEMLAYYREIFPEARLCYLRKDIQGEAEQQIPVYAEVSSKKQSQYMIIDPNGGKIYSGNSILAEGWYTITGDRDTSIAYPDNISIRKPGYVLNGWTILEADRGAIDHYTYVSALSLTMWDRNTLWIADWQEAPISKYTVHYDRNAQDALGDDMADDTIIYGENTPLSYPTYYYPHHRFTQWTQNPDGTGHWCPVKDYGRWDDDVSSKYLRMEDFGSENITLYAQWTDQGDASFVLDERKGYYDKYCVEDFYAIDCYTGEKKEPSSNVNNVFTAFSGDAVTYKIKPYIGYKLNGLYFETEHSGRQLYILGNNNTINSNNGLYDDLAVEKGADGSYTFTFTMKNDHIFSIEPKLLFAPDGNYVDENGETRNCIAEGASPLAFSPNDAEWTTGWYIVDEDCTLVTRPAVKGDVKLILSDGATLTAPRGIVVCGDNSLSIYGQSEGTGKLIATGQEKSDYYYATEGRGDIDCVHYESTAIGLAGLNESKYSLDGGTIKIYGGDITAVGQKFKEGIGVGDSGRIAIYGGTIHASSIREGNAHAPGIMTKDHDVYFAPGVCVIGHDGTIAAADRRAAVVGDYDHDAVVCPCEHDEGYLTVAGCSYCGESVYKALTLVQSAGGTVSADAGSAPEGYGQVGETVALAFEPDQGCHVKRVTITYDNGTSTTAVPENDAYSFTMLRSPATVTAEWALNIYTVSFDANGGTGEMDAVSGLYEDAVALPVSGFTAPEGKTFFSWCTKADGSGTKYSAGQAFTITEDTTLYARWSEGLYYIDESGTPTVTDGSCSEISDVSVDWNESTAEFYVVTEDVEINGRVHVSGAVGLILCDGAELTVSKGITVPKGSSLSIYSQNADTGKLTCNYSPVSEAAIGGAEDVDCGKITICGGVITATGGYYAAGIGASESAEYEEINIYGGTITAYGEGGGAGIGGGSWADYYEDTYKSNNGKINIDGKRRCTVNAYGEGEGSAGIGGGYGQGAGTIDIANATVQAEGGDFASGIGAGFYVDGYTMDEDAGTIRIHSGDITASSFGGVGIGCGIYAPDFGTIEISGGTIVATGDAAESASYESSGAGIGGNVGTTKGNVIITGGNITATGSSYERYGYFSPGIGASEASVSVSGPARITATGGNTWGIDGEIDLSAPAVVFGSVNESNLTKDQILSLKYAASGAKGEAPAPVYAPSGTELTAAERGSLAYDEHIFVGWNTDESGNGAAYAENGDITLDADTTLYAQWKSAVNNIIIAETSNGTVTASVGETENATTARYGDTVTLTVTPAAGYAVNAVSYNDGTDHTITPVEGVYAFPMPVSDVTVSATFVANTYAVSFNANGGVGSAMADQSFTYDEAAKALSANTYTRTGHDFEGWATEANGAKVYDDEESVSNLTDEADGTVTLYAVWTPRVYNIAIAETSNGTVTAKVGETENATTAHYGDTVTLTVTPSAGYAIGTVSYNDGSDHTITPTGGVYAFSMPAVNVTVTANTTVTAQWAFATPIIKGHVLQLNGVLGLKFYVELPEGFDPAGSKMTFTLSGSTQTVNFDAERTEYGYYYFPCRVKSFQMADTITAVYSWGDGEDNQCTETFSVQQYLATFTGTGVVADLARAIQNYGHYVQPYLAKANHWTVGTDHVAMPKYVDVNTDVDASAYALNTSVKTALIAESHYSLSLDANTALNLYLKLTDDSVTALTAQIDNRTPFGVTRRSDGYFRVTCSGIEGNNLGKAYLFTVKNGEETVFQANISALSFVNTVLSKTTHTDDTEVPAVCALYWYAQAADAYAKSITQ